MDERTSIRDMRRRAPLHFLAKADNARFAAYLLWHVPQQAIADAKAESNYGGTPEVGLHEALTREASLALELVLKALIAQRVMDGTAPPDVARVRPTHNLEMLWRDAALPSPLDIDARVLLFATRVLMWSGRYAAPRETADAHADQLERRLNDLTRAISKHSGSGIPFWAMSWNDFHSLYRKISKSFWTQRGDTD